MFRPDVARLLVLKNLLAGLGLIALSTLVYFLLPMGEFGSIGAWGFAAVFLLGLSAVSWSVIRQVRRYRSGAMGRIAPIAGVIASLYLAVLFFAAVYYALSIQHPLAIASLRTKVDALYFAVSITSTVGFGDVHAVSQLARVVVIIHIVFNIGFLGVAVSVLRRGSRPET
jgi:voltage-gated potassium channel